MTSSTSRPAHRARYDLPARARDVRLAALTALGHHPRGTAPRHRLPDPIEQLTTDLRAVGYSVADLTAQGVA